MEHVTFMVNETPYAVWDWELKKKNIQFLNGIDPEYFKYIAATNAEKLNGDEKQHAAIVLRVTYFQALETLFALIAATIQAPKCPLGWMLAYRNRELISVINKITLEDDIYTRLKNKLVTWQSIAYLIHKIPIIEEDRKNDLGKKFGIAWKRFAGEFLDEKNILEYNSAKHGLRVSAGGFYLSFGKATKWGVPAPPEKMECFGGSKYGTTFFIKKKIDGTNNINFRPQKCSLNWNPENLVNGLMLIGMSINNVLNFLKITNEVNPSECSYIIPNHDDDFNSPWDECVGVTSCNFDTILEVSDVAFYSKNEILDSYE